MDSVLNKKSVHEHLAYGRALIKANEEASIKLFSSQFLLSYGRFSVFIVWRMHASSCISACFSLSIANNCLKLLESSPCLINVQLVLVAQISDSNTTLYKYNFSKLIVNVIDWIFLWKIKSWKNGSKNTGR